MVTLVARNVKVAMVMVVVVLMVLSGGVCIWRQSGVRRSILCWFVWLEPRLNRLGHVFAFNLLHILILLYF
jgi:hypothetical protein